MDCLCGCGRPVKASDTGRPGKYYSNACKQSVYRERREHVTKLTVTKREDIRFYCGLCNEKDWNHHAMTPGAHACIAPVYGKSVETKRPNNLFVPAEVQEVLIDSGAFADRLDDRLSFEEARNRQIAHAYAFKYEKRLTHMASYDLLIDEKWQNGERSKRRWTVDEAELAVKETVAAARYLAGQRRNLRGIFGRPVNLALSAQGVEVEQYLRCAQQIAPLMEEGDLFGLGGWCITGILPDAIMPSFRNIMDAVIPYLASQGVKRTHVWGMIFPEGLAYLLRLCDQHKIKVSTDSSGPTRYPIMGEWGYGSWRDNSYKVAPILASCKTLDAQGKKAPTCQEGTMCRGLERCKHVQLTRGWLEHFRDREPELYALASVKKPEPKYKQLSWEYELVS